MVNKKTKVKYRLPIDCNIEVSGEREFLTVVIADTFDFKGCWRQVPMYSRMAYIRTIMRDKDYCICGVFMLRRPINRWETISSMMNS